MKNHIRNLRPALYILPLIIFMLGAVNGFSQKKFAQVTGKILDENENPLPGVSVTVLGQQSGIVTV